jgi:hypothetical protein
MDGRKILKIALISFVSFSLLVAILLYGFISLYKDKICEGKAFPSLSPHFLIFFPPDDLYTTILDHELDTSLIGKMQSFLCKHKYVGQYLVSLNIPQMREEEFFEDANFNMAFELLVGDKVKFRKVVDSNIDGMRIRKGDASVIVWGNGSELFKYNVPDDVPNQTEIRVNVTLNRINTQFPQKHGKINILIKKDPLAI